MLIWGGICCLVTSPCVPLLEIGEGIPKIISFSYSFLLCAERAYQHRDSFICSPSPWQGEGKGEVNYPC